MPDLSAALMKYAQLRPRDINLFVNVLVCMFEAGEAVPVEDLIGCLLPKMKVHAQSLELVHTLDLCQDDLAALLHLLMKVNSVFKIIFISSVILSKLTFAIFPVIKDFS